jgi:hypothetical protein
MQQTEWQKGNGVPGAPVSDQASRICAFANEFAVNLVEVTEVTSESARATS